MGDLFQVKRDIKAISIIQLLYYYWTLDSHVVREETKSDLCYLFRDLFEKNDLGSVICT